MVITAEADTGCGKTDFSLRCLPRPLLVIDLDRNMDWVEGKYGSDDVLIRHVEVPPTFDKDSKQDKERDSKILYEVQDLYMDAIVSNHFASIAVDTGGDLWELARRGILGGGLEFGDTKRQEYAPANAFMKSFFNAAKGAKSKVNLYVPMHTKEDFNTKKRVAEGWKQTIQCSQCHIRLYKDVGGFIPDKFHLEIMKCSINSECEQMTLDGADITFENLTTLVFG